MRKTTLYNQHIKQNGKILDFESVGNAHFIKLIEKQKKGDIQSIKVFYEGNPKVAVRPPWDGGATLGRLKPVAVRQRSVLVDWHVSDAQSPTAQAWRPFVPTSLPGPCLGSVDEAKPNSPRWSNFGRNGPFGKRCRARNRATCRVLCPRKIRGFGSQLRWTLLGPAACRTANEAMWFSRCRSCPKGASSPQRHMRNQGNS